MKNYQKPKTVFAKKSFGQNFLVDANYINKIIAVLDPQMGETIMEIGAGRGALTEKLIESGANIVAIEIERDMIAVLNGNFSAKENFRLIEADALKIDFAKISNLKFQISNSENQKPKTKDQKPKIKLVANLPYYISTAILQRLIEQREIFSEMILMFQREVVDRITAKPGSKERGFLTVLVEAYLETEKLFDVPPMAFRPAPKVNSAVVRLTGKETEIVNDEPFRELISAAFRQKRKTILNNLKDKFPNAETALSACRIDFQRRAEGLTIEEWRCLSELI